MFDNVKKAVLNVAKRQTEKEKQQLYICSRCGGKFMLASSLEGCPVCKRKKSDQVTDLDTGEVLGGELLLRRANRAETAVYLASEKAGKKKKEMLDNPLQQMLKGKGNTFVVVMNMNDEFGN